MKPNSQLENRNAQDAASSFPLIRSNYHVAAMPNLRGGCVRRESFRNISGEYFRNEARNEFQLEMTAFAAIIVTAVIPILSNLHALADFLRAIGSL